MDEIHYLLICLAEEGCEVGTAATKTWRFGLNDVHDGVPNLERLAAEIDDVLAVAEMLVARGVDLKFDDPARKAAKKLKLERLSRMCLAEKAVESHRSADA